MSSPIGAISFPPLPGIGGIGGPGGVAGAPGVSGTAAAGGTPGTSGSDFAASLSSALDQLQATQSHADGLAQQAATGTLQDVSDYMIASNEASLATDTVVTLKNQAVSAFNDIMRMPI